MLLYNIVMYKSDYDVIKNKNIKILFDLYNDRLLINFLDMFVISLVCKIFGKRFVEDDLLLICSSKCVNRFEINVILLEDEQEDDDVEDVDYEKESKCRKLEDEDFFKLKVLEFSKDIVNEKF